MNDEFLAKSFKEKLKHSNEDIAGCYRQLFDICGDDVINSFMGWLYLEYQLQKGKEQMWFYQFHKSIRQTDFFEDCYCPIKNSLLTSEEKVEFDKLTEWIKEKWAEVSAAEQESNPGVSNTRLYRQYFQTNHSKEYKRYCELRDNNNNVDKKSICGHLDMVLWNLIHMDKEAVLENIMLRTFKELDLEVETFAKEILNNNK